MIGKDSGFILDTPKIGGDKIAYLPARLQLETFRDRLLRRRPDPQRPWNDNVDCRQQGSLLSVRKASTARFRRRLS